MNGHNHHLNNTLCFMMHSDEGTVMNAKYPKAQRPDATTAGSKPRRPSSVVTSAWAVEKAKEKGKTLEEGSFHQRTTTKRPSHSTYPPPMDDASSIASSSISSSVRNVPVSHMKKKKNHVNDPPQQIWKTLQDAKERQNAIRDRVRSYSSGDEFSLSEDMQKPSSRSKNPYEDDEDDSDHHQNIMALPRPQQRPNGIKNKIPLQKKGKEKQHQRPSSPSIRSCSSRSTRQEEDDDSARPLTSDEAVRLVMQRLRANNSQLLEDDDESITESQGAMEDGLYQGHDSDPFYQQEEEEHIVTSNHDRRPLERPHPYQQDRAFSKSIAEQAVSKRHQQLQQQNHPPAGEAMPTCIAKAKAIHNGHKQNWGSASFPSSHSNRNHTATIHPNHHLTTPPNKEDSDIDVNEFFDAQEWEAQDPHAPWEEESHGSSTHSRPSSNASSGRHGNGGPIRRFSNFIGGSGRGTGGNDTEFGTGGGPPKRVHEVVERPSLFGALASSVTLASSVVTSTVTMTANMAVTTAGAIGHVGTTLVTGAGSVGPGGGGKGNAHPEVGSTMQSFFDRRKPKHPPQNTKIASRELEIIKRCQEQMQNREKLEEERRMKALAEDKENLKLRKMEEEQRCIVTREVLAYREMMKDMGQGDKLAPEDMKKAAEEYDDRLAMADTLAEQEEKARLAQQKMQKIDGGREKEEDHYGHGCCIIM